MVSVTVLAALLLGCTRERKSGQSSELGEKPPGSANTGAPVVGELTLLRQSRPVRDLSLTELERRVPPEAVTTLDPYLGGERTYACVPVMRMLDVFFDLAPGDARTFDLRLVAKDGYEVFVSGARLESGGACLALRQAGGAPIEPLGPAKADGRPLYLTWPGRDRTDLGSHPRPWAVATIDLDPDRSDLAATAPRAGFAGNSSAGRGHALFVERCVRCHSINQAGGKVGPDLNVPQNILAYRPREQVRAYIRNPATFRYGQMPPHLDLSERDLDALLEYLEEMGDHRADPRANAPGHGAGDH